MFSLAFLSIEYRQNTYSTCCFRISFDVTFCFCLQEEEFLGFRAEDLGLKAYRSFSLVSSGVSSPSKESSHPARPLSRQSSVNSVSEPASLPVPLKPKKKWFGAVVEEGYAKQYKKRDSYERKYSTRSEEHTSELQSRQYLVCRLLLEKKKKETRSLPSLICKQTTMTFIFIIPFSPFPQLTLPFVCS